MLVRYEALHQGEATPSEGGVVRRGVPIVIFPFLSELEGPATATHFEAFRINPLENNEGAEVQAFTVDTDRIPVALLRVQAYRTVLSSQLIATPEEVTSSAITITVPSGESVEYPLKSQKGSIIFQHETSQHVLSRLAAFSP